MKRQEVSSTNLHAVGYDEASQTLEIEFKNGGIYAYYHVPWAAYKALMEAPSHGQYFLAYIRGAYPFRRLR